jgi:hypothetical protein
MADNGVCRGGRSVWYFSGESPQRTADCKPNEVEVPRLIGTTLNDAKGRLAVQPLAYDVVYKPAAGQRLDVVSGRSRQGRFPRYDKVIPVAAKPPGVADGGRPASRASGSPARTAETAARRRRRLHGRVIRQRPRGRIAPHRACGPAGRIDRLR